MCGPFSQLTDEMLIINQRERVNLIISYNICIAFKIFEDKILIFLNLYML